MYLSKLELNGFKSFADKTTLTFDEGVTAIVGPNGCGKSNIVDAVRWVIGEQRPTALRSQKMENVIFNGTEKRKALGMAEVELTIQNNRGVLPTEYSEVSLGRRLFRSGDSEYLMNGTQCRLMDITELFMDTGMGADAYSVIELGMIDEILSDNAQDRRRLFEEAAGITKYKQRRRQSLRKLENTQSDLTRIRDLTDEIGKSVRRLKRQAGKAEKYNNLADRLHKLELHAAHSTFVTLHARQEEISEKQSTLGEELEEQKAAESALEAKVEDLQEILAEQEQIVRKHEEALQASKDRARDLKADIRLQQERIETAEQALNRLKHEETSAEGQAEDLRQLKRSLQNQHETTAPELEQAEEALTEAKALRDDRQRELGQLRARRQALQKKRDEAQTLRAQHQRQLDRLENRIELKEEDIERNKERTATFDSKAESLQERISEAEEKHASRKNQVEEVESRLKKVRSQKQQTEGELEEARSKLRAAEREQDSAETEVQLLENLLDSFEEFSDAVQFLADDSTWGTDRLRTVADVLACDDDHRVALETALGDLASCIVAEDSEEAQRALQHLRTSERGQATFLILNRLHQPRQDPEPIGSAMPLRDLVRATDDDCGELADALLHHAYLSESLEVAQDDIANASAPAICITPDGEWVDARGAVHGGSRRDQPTAVGGRLGRKEQLENSRAELSAASERIKKRRKEVDAIESRLEELPVEQVREELNVARREEQEALQDLQRARYAVESHDERQRELHERSNELSSELAELKSKKSNLHDETISLTERADSLKKKLASSQDELDQAEELQREALDAYNDARVEAVEIRNKAKTIERDLQRATERLNTLTHRAERRKEEIAEKQKTIEVSQSALADRQEKLDHLRDKQPERTERVEEALNAEKATREAINEAQEELRELRKDRDQLISRKNEYAVQRAEIDTRLSDLRERIRDDYERELEELPPAPDDFDREAAAREIKKLKNKIGRMGNVNPLAVEEYEEKKERLDFLTEQQEDLERAEETLLETITEINRTAADRFDETFSAIQKNFGKLFERLFGEGASARLTLGESEDPLDADINILAQPAGKTPSVLTQLSGGEKALTAIALLFAIYLVKPSPFCILDEVDAPLDDTNVQRFMNLIRDFEDDTQFILVTHDKHTMANSDRMYGITMQEQGVSTLVSVKFDEALAMVES